MRLTNIKLSGFKSFVDPTTIRTPGQLVGVVGPNGCGKSNVIDAVRWVLGETRASALRGESMQDVIFNGAGERKPVGRASVELVFDNSLGRIGGAWGQYAELAIKRVLTRDGDSSYFINNQQVRRRDIHDLFLGTGLGPRAYAIIEQGMISRIIEAKPEELRVFLEEAAGVSKYRERRKETESRLSDARDNLARVADIRSELGKQVEKLESQAKVAAQFRDMETERVRSQALLYSVKQVDAQRQRENAERDLAALMTEVEAKQASMREAEAEIEQLRTEQYAHNDALQAAQAAFYETNAEVSRIEQQMSFEKQRLTKLREDLASARQRGAGLENEAVTLKTEFELASEQLAEREAQEEEAKARLVDMEARMPALEQAARDAATKVADMQSALSGLEQLVQVATANKGNAERAMLRFDERRKRLTDEQTRLKGPDAQLKDDLEAAISADREDLEESAARLTELESNGTDFEGQENEARSKLNAQSAALTEQQARVQALGALQSRLAQNNAAGDLGAWLKGHGLGDSARFWQGLDIEKGWEDAVEGALRERLNAVQASSLASVSKHQDPPAKLAVFVPGGASARNFAADSLLAKVRAKSPAVEAALHEWLGHIVVADDFNAALARVASLQSGQCVVTRAGHVVSASSISYFKPDSEIHGVVARQRELAQLEADIKLLEPQVAEARKAVDAALQARRDHSARLGQERQSLASKERRIHDQEMELVQLKQAIASARDRDTQINTELTEIASLVTQETGLVQKIIAEIAAHALSREARVADRERARGLRNETDVALTKGRSELRDAERLAQEALYKHRSALDRKAELQRREAQVDAQRKDVALLVDKLQVDEKSILLDPLQSALDQHLTARKERETALAAARDKVEVIGADLRKRDEARLQALQAIEPLRAKSEDKKLKEQAARLLHEQMTEQLATLEVDADWLVQALIAAPKANALTSKVESLSQQIQALGPVNLAALEELKESAERKLYLDSQSEDLNEAAATLEDAIRRIDRETRALLQDTYDQVSKNFTTLFPTLFGGGNAKLTLTGDEILDSGVQVMAQPPGKRNQSIHLLSGGEKALTATALVFALFQINPAPFCLLDEVDAPLDDPNTERFCKLVREMSANTQFVFITHNKIAMEMAEQLVGITMPEPGVSRMVSVDIAQAVQMTAANVEPAIRAA